MSTLYRVILTGILYILTLASGKWLSHLGRPYHTMVFTLHKLISVGAVVFTVITVIHLLRQVDRRTAAVLLMVVTALFIVVLLVSGALLSIDKPVHSIFLTLHRILPIVTVGTTALTFYLLLR